MIEILLLALVPLAALGGWWLARKTFTRNETRRNRQFSSRYFQGLNYLLNEEADKAIEVFLEMAEVNKEKKLTRTVPSAKTVAGWVEQAKGLDPLITH